MTYVTITGLSGTCTIHATKIVENYEPKLIIIPVPNTGAGAVNPDNRTLFLGQASRAFTLDGYLSANSTLDGDAADLTAITQLNTLRDIAKQTTLTATLSITDTSAGTTHIFAKISDTTSAIPGFIHKIQNTVTPTDEAIPTIVGVTLVYLECTSLRA